MPHETEDELNNMVDEIKADRAHTEDSELDEVVSEIRREPEGVQGEAPENLPTGDEEFAENNFSEKNRGLFGRLSERVKESVRGFYERNIQVGIVGRLEMAYYGFRSKSPGRKADRYSADIGTVDEEIKKAQKTIEEALTAPARIKERVGHVSQELAEKLEKEKEDAERRIEESQRKKEELERRYKDHEARRVKFQEKREAVANKMEETIDSRLGPHNARLEEIGRTKRSIDGEIRNFSTQKRGIEKEIAKLERYAAKAPLKPEADEYKKEAAALKEQVDIATRELAARERRRKDLDREMKRVDGKADKWRDKKNKIHGLQNPKATEKRERKGAGTAEEIQRQEFDFSPEFAEEIEISPVEYVEVWNSFHKTTALIDNKDFQDLFSANANTPTSLEEIEIVISGYLRRDKHKMKRKDIESKMRWVRLTLEKKYGKKD